MKKIVSLTFFVMFFVSNAICQQVWKIVVATPSWNTATAYLVGNLKLCDVSTSSVRITLEGNGRAYIPTAILHECNFDQERILLTGFGGGLNYNDNYPVVIGHGNKDYNYNKGIAIGYNSEGNYDYGIGIGANSSNNNLGGIGIGLNSSSNILYGIGIGSNTNSNDFYGIGIGVNANANGTSGIGIGNEARANNNYAIGIGYNSQNNSPYGIGIGGYTYSQSSGVAVGWRANASGYNSIAIGGGARATAKNSVAVGDGCVNSSTNSFKLPNGYLFDASGRGRFSEGGPAPTSGVGVEILCVSSEGFVFAYDRGGTVYVPLHLSGSSIVLGGGNTLPGSITNNLGNATFYWNEVHCSTIVFHSLVDNITEDEAINTIKTLNINDKSTFEKAYAPEKKYKVIENGKEEEVTEQAGTSLNDIITMLIKTNQNLLKRIEELEKK